jgi:RING finger protein 121
MMYAPISFHEFCARGWVMVGKKDACPNCGDKVHLRMLVGSSPWETQSLVWVHLLDALRYLIVWNPVILIVTQLALNGMGLIHHMPKHAIGGMHAHGASPAPMPTPVVAIAGGGGGNPL